MSHKKRSNLELPAVLVQALKEKAAETGQSPSEITAKLISESRLTQEDLAVERINLSWGEDEENMLKAYQEQAAIRRGSETFPGSKHRVLEIILTKAFSEKTEKKGVAFVRVARVKPRFFSGREHLRETVQKAMNRAVNRASKNNLAKPRKAVIQ